LGGGGDDILFGLGLLPPTLKGGSLGCIARFVAVFVTLFKRLLLIVYRLVILKKIAKR
jgi:hypothetical protein